MKKFHKFLLIVIAALGFPVITHAVTLTQAQITQIIKDVKTIDAGKGSRPAALKETLQGEQAVRTGLESRTELLFNDQTITRLGANTHFSFSEGTRNMSLNSGVMLLQVPKGIGGAKIETAAVTAAVTGTTIMIEAGKDYTKLIVLEGKCCLWPKNKKLQNSPLQSKLSRMRHEVCAEAGQEIILHNGDTEVPPPVYVNLKVLENTSLLLNGKWGTNLNHEPINVAADAQGPDDFIPTNLAIDGAGTDVIIIQQLDPQNPPSPPDNPGAPGTPGNPPIPGKYGPLITITSVNPYTIGAGSAINTDPNIKTNGVTDYGRIYRGNTLDGTANPYFLGAKGTTLTDNGLNDLFHGENGEFFPNYGVAAFKFINLQLNALPAFNISTNGADDLALISEGGITINAPGVLDFSMLHNLAFATVNGNITVGANTTIQGLTGFLELYTASANNSININGTINLPGQTFSASAKGAFGGSGLINASYVYIQAGGLVTLNETVDEVSTIDTVNGVQLGIDSLSTVNLTGNTITVPQGFTGMPTDSSDFFVDLSLTANAAGTSPGDITLSQFIGVYSLNANAANNITLDSSSEIYSENEINLSAGGDIKLNGTIDNASSLYASGNNVTVDTAASLTVDGDAQFYGGTSVQINGSVSLDSEGTTTLTAQGGTVSTGSASHINADNFNITASNDVTLDGDIEVNTISASGNNISTLSTISTFDSVSASTSIGFNAANDITLGGSISTGMFSGTAGNNITLNADATLTADNVQLIANNQIEIEGFIGGGEESPSTSFTADTTQGLTFFATLPSFQDFFSTGETGAIDSLLIGVKSRGDLNLALGSGEEIRLNGVAVNPNGNLQELDLQGATVEIVNGLSINTDDNGDSPVPFKLSATATGGNITIGGGIELGDEVNPGEFDGTAFGHQIVLTGSGTTITASTVNLTADSILNQTGGTGPLIVITDNPAGNLSPTLALSTNTDGVLSQTGASSLFTYVQTTGAVPIASGTLPFQLSGSGSSPTLNISANALTVAGTLDASQYANFTLILTAANDINSGTTANINGVTSFSGKVGVDATLVNDSELSTLSYNGSQLVIDTSRLSSFSFDANSILVTNDDGFPSLGGDLSLTSSGTAGITVEADLNIGNSVTLTASNLGTVTVDGAVSTGGDFNITAGNGITVSGDLGVIDISTIGGNATFQTGQGDILINSVTVLVDGNLSLTASTGNITLGTDNSEIEIGGGVTLSAAGTISVGNSVTLDGSLNITAGTGIAILPSSEFATFFGATDVTLALTGTAASLTQSSDGSLLNFGAQGQSIGDMIGIDLDGGTVTSVSASGTSITLSGSFNVSVPVSLVATNGSVVVSGTETKNIYSLSANATNGNIVVNAPLVLSSGFSGTATGSIAINAPLSASSFFGVAAGVAINSTVNVSTFEADATSPTGSVSGTGSVTARNVTLSQGSAATVSQNGSQATAGNQFSFNTTLSLTLTNSGTDPATLTLQGAPLNFTTALTLQNTNLTLIGQLKTNGNLINATNVALNSVSTVTDASGNATALSVSGNSVSIDSLNMSGAFGTKGSGGILSGTARTLNLNVSTYLFADGGSAGGNGGTINLTASQGSINNNTEISASGGTGSGNGGTVNLTSQGDVSTFIILANGGDATSSKAAGGNGGTVNINSQGDINVNGGIHATSGKNGSTTFPGGKGGAVNLVAQGAINVNDTIEVSSSDLVNNRVSAAPGNITVTSHLSAGSTPHGIPAIKIASSAQLNSLLNQAAVGPGGKITFVADGGGDISVSGKVRADHGTVDIENRGTATGDISLTGATLSGDVVKASVLSPNGTLTIGTEGTTNISADTAIKLYALGNNGSVNFVGNTNLSGNSIKSIAGQIVTISSGVSVHVTGGAATVYTNMPNYTGSGGNASTTGQFTGNNNTTTKPFASRPAF